jgi:hypothetical protein
MFNHKTNYELHFKKVYASKGSRTAKYVLPKRKNGTNGCLFLIQVKNPFEYAKGGFKFRNERHGYEFYQ